MPVDQEKLAKLQAASRVGGKGTPRRKATKKSKASGSGEDGKDRSAASAKKSKLVTPSASENEDADMFDESGNVLNAQPSMDSYSYGQLESAHRWHLVHRSSNSMLVRMLLPPGRNGPFTMTQIQAQITQQTKLRFRFTALDRQLQLRVAEMMDYADLQCLARTSNAMKELVGTRTKRLDAALFRTEPSVLPSLASSPGKSETGKCDDSIEFHPIITRIKHRNDPFQTWEQLIFQLRDWNNRDRKSRKERPLAKLYEIRENATEPPCFQLKLSYSSERAYSDDDYYVYDEDEPRPGKDPLVQRITVIEGSKDAAGRPLPITVEQFVKAHLEALHKEPDCKDAFICSWMFMTWDTRYIDANGCLHLLDAQWRKRKMGYYMEKSDGGYSTRSEDKRSDDEYDDGGDGWEGGDYDY